MRRTQTPLATTHTLVTEPYTPPADSKVRPGNEWRRLTCADENCPWGALYIVNDREGGSAEEAFAREHGDVFTLGKVPRIEVDWTPQAYCAVCPDHAMTALEFDGESLTCPTCGSYWGMDGDPGDLGERFREQHGMPRGW